MLDERAKQIEGLVRRAEPANQGGVVKAPMPGLVLRIPVSVGQAVAAGQGVLVLEAMKMENEIKAAGAGRGDGDSGPAGAGGGEGAGPAADGSRARGLTRARISRYLVSLS